MTKEKLRCIIGANIRNQRVLRDMSLEELAELLDLSIGSVGLIERGERGATNFSLVKLSEIFRVSIDDLFRERELRVAEVSEEKTKRTKISSLIYDFNLSELEFLISVIKNLKQMNLSLRMKSKEDEETEE